MENRAKAVWFPGNLKTSTQANGPKVRHPDIDCQVPLMNLYCPVGKVAGVPCTGTGHTSLVMTVTFRTA